MGKWFHVPTTEIIRCEMCKLKLWSDLLAEALSCMNTISLGICGHLYHGAFCECKAQSYVASVSNFIIV